MLCAKSQMASYIILTCTRNFLPGREWINHLTLIFQSSCQPQFSEKWKLVSGCKTVLYELGWHDFSNLIHSLKPDTLNRQISGTNEVKRHANPPERCPAGGGDLSPLDSSSSHILSFLRPQPPFLFLFPLSFRGCCGLCMRLWGVHCNCTTQILSYFGKRCAPMLFSHQIFPKDCVIPHLSLTLTSLSSTGSVNSRES